MKGILLPGFLQLEWVYSPQIGYSFARKMSILSHRAAWRYNDGWATHTDTPGIMQTMSSPIRLASRIFNLNVTYLKQINTILYVS